MHIIFWVRYQIIADLCVVHPIICLWFLVTFVNKVTKIQNYYAIFVEILQGKMGKMEKNLKENRATKVTKIPKTKSRKYEMNETFFWKIRI